MKQYLDLMETVLTKGRHRVTPRNGASTLGVFGEQMRFDLSEGFPLITTRKLNYYSAIAEMVWMLSGSTNNEDLNALDVHIWDQWAAPASLPERLNYTIAERKKLYTQKLALQSTNEGAISLLVNGSSEVDLDKAGIPRNRYRGPAIRKGELGPIYGQMWRAWPSASGTSIDQIQTLLDNLRNRPYSRRHVISAWNPALLPDENLTPVENIEAGRQCLPACHTTVQFSVEPMTIAERFAWFETHVSQMNTRRMKLVPEGDPSGFAPVLTGLGVPTDRLSCNLFARSQDVPVGTAFNMVGYAFLTMAIAHVLRMAPGEYIHSCGDAHIYTNQVELAKVQLKRKPKNSPTLRFTNKFDSLFDIRASDVAIDGYSPHPIIKYPVTI